MPQETIEGVIEEIIFFNPDNGYTVLSLAPNSQVPGVGDDSIVVVGKLLELHPGETVRFTGFWTTHPEYGEQFKAQTMHLVTNAGSLKRYLASGLIEGIGEQTAKKILDHFGDKAMDILDNAPERIREVPGIRTDRARRIAESWGEQRKQRKVLLFLQNYGITAELAYKIYETYGDDTIQVVESDPYQLTLEVEGVDFKTADQIAQVMGLSLDAPGRSRAGIIFALTTLNADGHIYAPRPLVVEKAAAMLEVPASRCEQAVESLIKDGEIVAFKQMPTPDGSLEVLYLRRLYAIESKVARHLVAMTKAKSALKKTPDWEAFFSKLARSKGHVALTDQQQDAVRAALTHKVSVLTGGPGTGKTTTLRAVIEALDSVRARYALACPTGRAARRLAEATGQDAYTIHRLLGYSIDGEFAVDESAPLKVDAVIIDEASMVDLELFCHLLAAIPDRAHLMLVGDVDQLPSVGAGDVLRDVIASGIGHVTRLDVIFRQASESLIVHNAHRVNRGEMPDLSNNGSDFFLFSALDGDPGAAADLLVDVVQNRIPKRFGLDPLNEVQVLAPMYKGDVGINALNERLQAVLNPPGSAEEYLVAGRNFRVGDKVIQTRNNYEKDVYNGDIGRITAIDPVEQEMEVNMDGRIVTYQWRETHDLLHAFAISVHRSQGGEYPAAVIAVVSQHARMLQRNLLYTAITRARRLVVLIGTRRAIQTAVENDRVAKRYSGLVWQLEKALKETKQA